MVSSHPWSNSPSNSSVVSFASFFPHLPRNPTEGFCSLLKTFTPPTAPIASSRFFTFYFTEKAGTPGGTLPTSASENSPSSSSLLPVWLSRSRVLLSVKAAIFIHQSWIPFPGNILFSFPLLPPVCSMSPSLLTPVEQLNRRKSLKSKTKNDGYGNSGRYMVTLSFIC